MLPKQGHANITQSTTDGSLVAAVANRRIRVIELEMQAGATDTTVVFNSKGAGAGTAISETYTAKAGVWTPLPLNPGGYFDTNSGEGLTATTGAGATVAFRFNYQLLQDPWK